MSPILSEVRLALRQFGRHRGFAGTVICTLALTIGATTAVFAVVHTMLIRGLPFASPDRLVWVASVRADISSAPFTLPEFMDYREQTGSLSGLAAFAYWAASLSSDGVTERLTGARMSGNAFTVLGMSAAAGRLLTEADDDPRAAPVVVLSYQIWQRRYGGDTAAIGKTARINGAPFVIVGVLPPHVPLPLLQTEVVTQLAPDSDPLRYVRSSANFLRLFGRLQDGTDAARAQAELTAICRSLREQFPIDYARKDSVRVTPVHEVLVADYRQSMLLLFAAVSLVLATALANLASLALVRANGRRSDLLMRITLGASPLRLARQLGVESLVLAATGSVLGWVVASYATRAAVAWAPVSIPRLREASLDSTAALFVVALTVVVAALLTAAPLSGVANARAGDALRGWSRGAIGDRWNQRVRDVMVVAQISIALLLLLATTGLVRNLRELRDTAPGFLSAGVFQARVSIPATYRSPEDIARFHDQLIERLAASPGVQRVGVISIAPLSGLLAAAPFSLVDRPLAERDRPAANIRMVSPGYLGAVGTRLLQGRQFSESDRLDTPRVALVSAALADRFMEGRAVGRQLLIDDNNEGPRTVEVVGVVENVRQEALDRPATLDIYLPLRQLHPIWVAALRNNQFWMVKTGSHPDAFRGAFINEVRAVDPDAAVAAAGAMSEFVDDSLGPRRFNLGLFGAFASTAVLLALIGLYGLVSYAVSQRTREIGLRMALGASERDVERLVLRQAALLAGAGVTLGLICVNAVQPIVMSIAPSTGLGSREGGWVPHVVAAGIAAGLVLLVMIGAWIPARRAARLAPTHALNS